MRFRINIQTYSEGQMWTGILKGGPCVMYQIEMDL